MQTKYVDVFHVSWNIVEVSTGSFMRVLRIEHGLHTYLDDF